MKKFRTWNEAFRSLTPSMRQHSVRVADYTQVLFDGVCKSSYYTRDEEKPAYLDSAYREIAYKCGFFHQIGKANEPEEYPEWKPNAELDEKNHYCRYTVEGKELAVKLQTERHGADEERIPDKMIQEACEFHMEHWDGNGFPYGYQGTEISLIAQIVGLAKEMDRLVCTYKSETPYEDAVDKVLEEEDKMFSPYLIDVFRECQPELKLVYKKYIQYTKIMPKTVPLVERRPDRPFGLKYRQIVAGEALENFIFEAVPWFGGVLDKPEVRETAGDVEAMLMRTGLTRDITMYFLYEAADALARMKNCQLYTGGIMLPAFDAFYGGENHLERLEKLFADTGVDRRKLQLAVQEEVILKDRKAQEHVSSYIEQGVVMMLDNYHPEEVPISLLREIGFIYVRIAKDSPSWNDMKQTAQELKNHGITMIDWPSGETSLTEDELIRYLMNFE